MNKNEVIGSAGHHTYNRIGRPSVVYDQRAKYSFDAEEFERVMAERKRIGNSDVIIESSGITLSDES